MTDKKPSKILLNISRIALVVTILIILMFVFFALTDGEKWDWIGVARGSIILVVSLGWYVRERNKYFTKLQEYEKGKTQ